MSLKTFKTARIDRKPSSSPFEKKKIYFYSLIDFILSVYLPISIGFIYNSSFVI